MEALTVETYEKTHPWMSFSINLAKAPARLWVMLGECMSLCEFIADVPLGPGDEKDLQELFLTQSSLYSTSLDGNTLTEEEVRSLLFGDLEVPPSKQYLALEHENLVRGYDFILDHILEYPNSTLNLAAMKELNRLVLDRVVLEPGMEPGQIRSSEITLPSHRFTVAPAEYCYELLDRLCNWINSRTFDSSDRMEIVYGVLKAIVTKLYLTWIHPFSKGNNRTAHLAMFLLLVKSGVPVIATYHFSRLYTVTRYDFFRHIEKASQPKGKILPFIIYSVQGFLDGLREQVKIIRDRQSDMVFENYVHDRFAGKTSLADLRRSHLVLDLAKRDEPVPASEISTVSTRMTKYYSTKTNKTQSRDVADLVKAGLIQKTAEGVMVRKDIVRAFSPHKTKNT